MSPVQIVAASVSPAWEEETTVSMMSSAESDDTGSSSSSGRQQRHKAQKAQQGGGGGYQKRHQKGHRHQHQQQQEPAPWLPAQHVDGGIDLGTELHHFADFLSLTGEEGNLRESYRTVLQQATQRVWPPATVKVHGSFASGTSLPHSSLDLVVEGCFPLDAQHVQWLCTTLEQSYGMVLTHLGDAVFTLRHLTHPLTCTVTLVPQGKSDARKAAATVRGYCTRCPAFKPVLLTLKWILSQCSLMDTGKGGLSGHALTAMLAHLVDSLGEGVNASTLLLVFLKHYGEFDYAAHTVGCTSSQRLHPPSSPLSVAGLLVPSSNAAHSTTQVRQVKAMLKYLRIALEKWDSDGPQQGAVDVRGKTPLSTVVAVNQLLGRRRK